MSDNGATFKFAKVSYPLPAQTAGTSLLTVCDPTVAKILDFVGSILTTHIGAALTGAASGGAAPIASTVGTKISINPAEVAKVEQLFQGSPLLAVWRKTSTKNKRTINWVHSEWIFGAAYILPPLTAAQAVKFHPILSAVDDIITQRVSMGRDPSYNGGERIIFDNDIEYLRVQSSEIGRWDPVGDTMDFHGWFAEIAGGQRDMPTSVGLPPYAGSDVGITDESVQEGNPILVTQDRFEP